MVLSMLIGNDTGYPPELLPRHPHPYPLVPLPVNSRVFRSKWVQNHDFWTRNERDITYLNKSAISHSVLVQKLWFWTRLKVDGSGFHDPYPYPRLPVSVTRDMLMFFSWSTCCSIDQRFCEWLGHRHCWHDKPKHGPINLNRWWRYQQWHC